MDSLPQATAEENSWAHNPLFQLAHRISDTINSLRLRMARKSHFVPATIAYTGYGSTTWVRVMARVLLSSRPLPGTRADREAKAGEQNLRGWRAFTSVPIPNRDVDIEIGGTTVRVKSDRGGMVDTVVPVQLEPGWHKVSMRASGTDTAHSLVFVIGAETEFGIVSDIDDTVMITALPRPFLALWNTFVLSERARMATPGMSVLMDRLRAGHPQAPIIYLSTGPWNAAPTLARFLSRNLYPAGPLLLTDWGLTQHRWFRSGREHKMMNLQRLAQEFPDVKWLLIGDNGQHDEEIYSTFSQAHPGNVAAIAIRQLSVSESVLAGGHSEDGDHSGSSVPWVYSPDGAGMVKQLDGLDIV
ncbi:App1 family protein [Pseudarthrobacter sp. J1738]|uniref:App1 family protein n=1 Tax=Pseudarthrobacter sp. J1738 TaxID=3420446 RepID=UPI003D27076C